MNALQESWHHIDLWREKRRKVRRLWIGCENDRIGVSVLPLPFNKPSDVVYTSITSVMFLPVRPRSHFDDLPKDIRGIPSDAEIPGALLGVDSDGFFDLEEQPKWVAIIGAGYIVVELAMECGRTFGCGGEGGVLKG